MDDFIDSAIKKVNDYGVHYDINCFKSKPNQKPYFIILSIHMVLLNGMIFYHY